MDEPVTSDETLGLYRDSVRKFLEGEFKPELEGWRKAGQIARDFFRKAGTHGLLCPTVPEEFGGPQCDFRFNMVVVEEVARCGVSPVAFAVHSDICANYIVRWGSEVQKRSLLPRMVSGEILAAIAMTEPGAGSDLKAVRTTAVRSGDGYVINGGKTFISNGQNAELVIVVAKTDPGAGAKGITLFLVETDNPGFRRGRKLEKMGGHEQDTSELFFDDAFVPAAAVLGEEGQGFAILMEELRTERLSLAIAAVTAAETAFEITLDYVKARTAFGQPLIALQNTGFKLADLRAHLRMARAYVDQCLRDYLAGRFTAVHGAEAKLVTTQLQCRVVDECLQLHGGYGWMDEYLISRLYTDARVQRIYGGADEVLKLVISRSL